MISCAAQSPTSCPGHGSYNNPINCNDHIDKFQSKVKDDATCFQWCSAQCFTNGGSGDIGGVCRCRYRRSARRNQTANTEIGVCLFPPPVAGISDACVQDWRTDTLADWTDVARNAWWDVVSVSSNHTRSCNQQHPDGDTSCKTSNGGCKCDGEWPETATWTRDTGNGTFLDSCAQVFPVGGKACHLDFSYDNSTWENYKWACHPRGCSADDIAKIEQFKEHSRLPGVKVKTFSCTKASSND